MWTPLPKRLKLTAPFRPLALIALPLLFAGCARPLQPVSPVIPQPPAGAMVAPSRGHLNNAQTDIQNWQQWLTDMPIS